MNNIVGFALNLIESNPQIANSPNGQELINVIRSNDSKRGEEIARNICASRGVSIEQAQQEARRFFGI